MRVSRRDVIEGRTQCVYCGVVATSVDHIPPILLKHEVAENERYCVPACLECNSALGAKRLFTLLDRQVYMREWIKRRYAKFLRVQNRTPDAISDLGYNIQTMLEHAISVREWIVSRISYDFNSNTTWLKYFASARESKSCRDTNKSIWGEMEGLPEPFLMTFSEQLDELLETDPWINGPEVNQNRFSVA